MAPNLPSYSVCISRAFRISSLQAGTVLNRTSRGCWRHCRRKGLPGSGVIAALAARFWDEQWRCAPHARSPSLSSSSWFWLWEIFLWPSRHKLCGLQTSQPSPVSWLQESWFPLFACSPPWLLAPRGWFLLACSRALPGSKVLHHPLGCSHTLAGGV